MPHQYKKGYKEYMKDYMRDYRKRKKAELETLRKLGLISTATYEVV